MESRLPKELRQNLDKAQEEIAFLRLQSQRLTQEARPALKENALLRYELFKCQGDRSVLAFHLSGWRAELAGALALLSRLAPGEPPREVPLLQAFLELREAGWRLGVTVQALMGAEKVAQTALGERQVFNPERFLRMRLTGSPGTALERGGRKGRVSWGSSGSS
ncbi:hypothetical protein [Thermus altitudinis]|uniref:hypothetical protein n=1 Tax=Thermus altitudinis TaxID=2908145 RepID=UPI001FA9FE64|nr:hypothetical protein [Thermus altitudinis]